MMIKLHAPLSQDTFAESIQEKVLRRRSFLVGTSALAASPFAYSNSEAEKTVRLGYLPVNAMTSIYMDAALGKDSGRVPTSLQRIMGGPAIVQGIQGDSLDAGECAVTVLLSLASRGIPIVLLAMSNNVTTQFPYNRIMVKKDSPLKSVADLRGKKVGILALGTLDHVLVLAALKRENMSKSDVYLVSVPVPNQPQALESGQVDAMMMPPPADEYAVQTFNARELEDATKAFAYYPLEVLIAGEAWVEKNPELATSMAADWIKTNRWIAKEQNAARMIAQERLQLPDNISKTIRMPQWSVSGLPVMPGIWNIYHAMVEVGIIQPPKDPKAMMERYFINPVQRITIPALRRLPLMTDEVTERLNSVPLSYLPEGPRRYIPNWK